MGLYWETYEKEGYDLVRQSKVRAARRRIEIDYELPMEGAYSGFLHGILSTLKQEGFKQL